MANVRVAVRVRPLSEREVEEQVGNVVSTDGNTLSITNVKVETVSEYGDSSRDRVKHFTFDYCYNSSLDRSVTADYPSQELVYRDLGTQVLQAASDGYNACLFAYGQTGSGKTFTMMGYPDEIGLTPRICEGLFAYVDTCPEDNITFRVELSYMEIYNERVRDLLKPSAQPERFTLKVREHPKEGPYVQDLSRHPVKDYHEIQTLLDRGNQMRTTAATHMHQHSSRSHAIVTVRFTQAKLEEKLPSEMASKIHLVDLAGSERADPNYHKRRITEGGSINKSLNTLGNVIKALAENSLLAWSAETVSSANGGTSGGEQQTGSPPHSNGNGRKPRLYIPYRDSVLTWILKDSLGGNSKTLMIATISPAHIYYTETISTLRYAQRAKSIVNKPRVNEDDNVSLIRQLRQEVERLKSMLESVKMVGGTSPNEMFFLLPGMDKLLNPDTESDEQGMSVLTAHNSGAVLTEKLKENEAIANQLTQSWLNKWRETQSLMQESDLSIRGLGGRSSSLGVIIDSQLPHLIGMDEDVLSTGVVIYQLKEGKTLIGRENARRQQDIVLDGIGIQSEHCLVKNNSEQIVLQPRHGAVCTVNGVVVHEPTPLTQGDVLVFGKTSMFRFNNPAQAAKLRRHRQNLQIEGSQLDVSLSAASSMMSLAEMEVTTPKRTSHPNLDFEQTCATEAERIQRARTQLDRLRAEVCEKEEAGLLEEEELWSEHEKHREELVAEKERLARLRENLLSSKEQAQQLLLRQKQQLVEEEESYKRQLQQQLDQLTHNKGDDSESEQTALHFHQSSVSSQPAHTETSTANCPEWSGREIQQRRQSVEGQIKGLAQSELLHILNHRQTAHDLQTRVEAIEEEILQSKEEVVNCMQEIREKEEQYRNVDVSRLDRLHQQKEQLEELQRQEEQLELYLQEKQELLAVSHAQPRPLRGACSELTLLSSEHAHIPLTAASVRAASEANIGECIDASEMNMSAHPGLLDSREYVDRLSQSATDFRSSGRVGYNRSHSLENFRLRGGLTHLRDDALSRSLGSNLGSEESLCSMDYSEVSETPSSVYLRRNGDGRGRSRMRAGRGMSKQFPGQERTGSADEKQLTARAAEVTSRLYQPKSSASDLLRTYRSRRDRDATQTSQSPVGIKSKSPKPLLKERDGQSPTVGKKIEKNESPAPAFRRKGRNREDLERPWRTSPEPWNRKNLEKPEKNEVTQLNRTAKDQPRSDWDRPWRQGRTSGGVSKSTGTPQNTRTQATSGTKSSTVISSVKSKTSKRLPISHVTSQSSASDLTGRKTSDCTNHPGSKELPGKAERRNVNTRNEHGSRKARSMNLPITGDEELSDPSDADTRRRLGTSDSNLLAGRRQPQHHPSRSRLQQMSSASSLPSVPEIATENESDLDAASLMADPDVAAQVAAVRRRPRRGRRQVTEEDEWRRHSEPVGEQLAEALAQYTADMEGGMGQDGLHRHSCLSPAPSHDWTESGSMSFQDNTVSHVALTDTPSTAATIYESSPAGGKVGVPETAGQEESEEMTPRPSDLNNKDQGTDPCRDIVDSGDNPQYASTVSPGVTPRAVDVDHAKASVQRDTSEIMGDIGSDCSEHISQPGFYVPGMDSGDLDRNVLNHLLSLVAQTAGCDDEDEVTSVHEKKSEGGFSADSLDDDEERAAIIRRLSLDEKLDNADAVLKHMLENSRTALNARTSKNVRLSKVILPGEHVSGNRDGIGDILVDKEKVASLTEDDSSQLSDDASSPAVEQQIEVLQGVLQQLSGRETTRSGHGNVGAHTGAGRRGKRRQYSRAVKESNSHKADIFLDKSVASGVKLLSTPGPSSKSRRSRRPVNKVPDKGVRKQQVPSCADLDVSDSDGIFSRNNSNSDCNKASATPCASLDAVAQTPKGDAKMSAAANTEHQSLTERGPVAENKPNLSSLNPKNVMKQNRGSKGVRKEKQSLHQSSHSAKDIAPASTNSPKVDGSVAMDPLSGAEYSNPVINQGAFVIMSSHEIIGNQKQPQYPRKLSTTPVDTWHSPLILDRSKLNKTSLAQQKQTANTTGSDKRQNQDKLAGLYSKYGLVEELAGSSDNETQSPRQNLTQQRDRDGTMRFEVTINKDETSILYNVEKKEFKTYTLRDTEGSIVEDTTSTPDSTININETQTLTMVNEDRIQMVSTERVLGEHATEEGKNENAARVCDLERERSGSEVNRECSLHYRLTVEEYALDALNVTDPDPTPLGSGIECDVTKSLVESEVVVSHSNSSASRDFPVCGSAGYGRNSCASSLLQDRVHPVAMSSEASIVQVFSEGTSHHENELAIHSPGMSADNSLSAANDPGTDSAIDVSSVGGQSYLSDLYLDHASISAVDVSRSEGHLSLQSDSPVSTMSIELEDSFYSPETTIKTGSTSSGSSEYRTPQQSPRVSPAFEDSLSLEIVMDQLCQKDEPRRSEQQAMPDQEVMTAGVATGIVDVGSRKGQSSMQSALVVVTKGQPESEEDHIEAVRQALKLQVEQKLAKLQRRVRSLSDSAISSDFTESESAPVSPCSCFKPGAVSKMDSLHAEQSFHNSGHPLSPDEKCEEWGEGARSSHDLTYAKKKRKMEKNSQDSDNIHEDHWQDTRAQIQDGDGDISVSLDMQREASQKCIGTIRRWREPRHLTRSELQQSSTSITNTDIFAIPGRFPERVVDAVLSVPQAWPPVMYAPAFLSPGKGKGLLGRRTKSLNNLVEEENLREQANLIMKAARSHSRDDIDTPPKYMFGNAGGEKTELYDLSLAVEWLDGHFPRTKTGQGYVVSHHSHAPTEGISHAWLVSAERGMLHEYDEMDHHAREQMISLSQEPDTKGSMRKQVARYFLKNGTTEFGREHTYVQPSATIRETVDAIEEQHESHPDVQSQPHIEGPPDDLSETVLHDCQPLPLDKTAKMQSYEEVRQVTACVSPASGKTENDLNTAKTALNLGEKLLVYIGKHKEAATPAKSSETTDLSIKKHWAKQHFRGPTASVFQKISKQTDRKFVEQINLPENTIQCLNIAERGHYTHDIEEDLSQTEVFDSLNSPQLTKGQRRMLRQKAISTPNFGPELHESATDQQQSFTRQMERPASLACLEEIVCRKSGEDGLDSSEDSICFVFMNRILSEKAARLRILGSSLTTSEGSERIVTRSHSLENVSSGGQRMQGFMPPLSQCSASFSNIYAVTTSDVQHRDCLHRSRSADLLDDGTAGLYDNESVENIFPPARAYSESDVSLETTSVVCEEVDVSSQREDWSQRTVLLSVPLREESPVLANADNCLADTKQPMHTLPSAACAEVQVDRIVNDSDSLYQSKFVREAPSWQTDIMGENCVHSYVKNESENIGSVQSRGKVQSEIDIWQGRYEHSISTEKADITSNVLEIGVYRKHFAQSAQGRKHTERTNPESAVPLPRLHLPPSCERWMELSHIMLETTQIIQGLQQDLSHRSHNYNPSTPGANPAVPNINILSKKDDESVHSDNLRTSEWKAESLSGVRQKELNMTYHLEAERSTSILQTEASHSHPMYSCAGYRPDDIGQPVYVCLEDQLPHSASESIPDVLSRSQNLTTVNEVRTQTGSSLRNLSTIAAQTDRDEVEMSTANGVDVGQGRSRPGTKDADCNSDGLNLADTTYQTNQLAMQTRTLNKVADDIGSMHNNSNFGQRDPILVHMAFPRGVNVRCDTQDAYSVGQCDQTSAEWHVSEHAGDTAIAIDVDRSGVESHGTRVLSLESVGLLAENVTNSVKQVCFSESLAHTDSIATYNAMAETVEDITKGSSMAILTDAVCQTDGAARHRRTDKGLNNTSSSVEHLPTMETISQTEQSHDMKETREASSSMEHLLTMEITSQTEPGYDMKETRESSSSMEHLPTMETTSQTEQISDMKKTRDSSSSMEHLPTTETTSQTEQSHDMTETRDSSSSMEHLLTMEITSQTEPGYDMKETRESSSSMEHLPNMETTSQTEQISDMKKTRDFSSSMEQLSTMETTSQTEQSHDMTETREANSSMEHLPTTETTNQTKESHVMKETRDSSSSLEHLLTMEITSQTEPGYDMKMTRYSNSSMEHLSTMETTSQTEQGSDMKETRDSSSSMEHLPTLETTSQTDQSHDMKETRDSSSSMEHLITMETASQTDQSHDMKETRDFISSMEHLITMETTSQTDQSHDMKETRDSSSSMEHLITMETTSQTDQSHDMKETRHFRSSMEHLITMETTSQTDQSHDMKETRYSSSSMEHLSTMETSSQTEQSHDLKETKDSSSSMEHLPITETTSQTEKSHDMTELETREAKSSMGHLPTTKTTSQTDQSHDMKETREASSSIEYLPNTDTTRQTEQKHGTKDAREANSDMEYLQTMETTSQTQQNHDMKETGITSGGAQNIQTLHTNIQTDHDYDTVQKSHRNRQTAQRLHESDRVGEVEIHGKKTAGPIDRRHARSNTESVQTVTCQTEEDTGDQTTRDESSSLRADIMEPANQTDGDLFLSKYNMHYRDAENASDSVVSELICIEEARLQTDKNYLSQGWYEAGKPSSVGEQSNTVSALVNISCQTDDMANTQYEPRKADTQSQTSCYVETSSLKIHEPVLQNTETQITEIRGHSASVGVKTDIIEELSTECQNVKLVHKERVNKDVLLERDVQSTSVAENDGLNSIIGNDTRYQKQACSHSLSTPLKKMEKRTEKMTTETDMSVTNHSDISLRASGNSATTHNNENSDEKDVLSMPQQQRQISVSTQMVPGWQIRCIAVHENNPRAVGVDSYRSPPRTPQQGSLHSSWDSRPSETCSHSVEHGAGRQQSSERGDDENDVDNLALLPSSTTGQQLPDSGRNCSSPSSTNYSNLHQHSQSFGQTSAERPWLETPPVPNVPVNDQHRMGDREHLYEHTAEKTTVNKLPLSADLSCQPHNSSPGLSDKCEHSVSTDISSERETVIDTQLRGENSTAHCHSMAQFGDGNMLVESIPSQSVDPESKTAYASLTFSSDSRSWRQSTSVDSLDITSTVVEEHVMTYSSSTEHVTEHQAPRFQAPFNTSQLTESQTIRVVNVEERNTLYLSETTEQIQQESKPSTRSVDHGDSTLKQHNVSQHSALAPSSSNSSAQTYASSESLNRIAPSVSTTVLLNQNKPVPDSESAQFEMSCEQRGTWAVKRYIERSSAETEKTKVVSAEADTNCQAAEELGSKHEERTGESGTVQTDNVMSVEQGPVIIVQPNTPRKEDDVSEELCYQTVNQSLSSAPRACNDDICYSQTSTLEEESSSSSTVPGRHSDIPCNSVESPEDLPSTESFSSKSWQVADSVLNVTNSGNTTGPNTMVSETAGMYSKSLHAEDFGDFTLPYSSVSNEIHRLQAEHNRMMQLLQKSRRRCSVPSLGPLSRARSASPQMSHARSDTSSCGSHATVTADTQSATESSVTFSMSPNSRPVPSSHVSATREKTHTMHRSEESGVYESTTKRHSIATMTGQDFLRDLVGDSWQHALADSTSSGKANTDYALGDVAESLSTTSLSGFANTRPSTAGSPAKPPKPRAAAAMSSCDLDQKGKKVMDVRTRHYQKQRISSEIISHAMDNLFNRSCDLEISRPPMATHFVTYWAGTPPYRAESGLRLKDDQDRVLCDGDVPDSRDAPRESFGDVDAAPALLMKIRKSLVGVNVPPLDHLLDANRSLVSTAVEAVVNSSDDFTQTDAEDDNSLLDGSRGSVASSGNSETHNIRAELDRLHQERVEIIELLSLRYLPGSLTVELLEAKLNYCLGQTDALLASLEEAWAEDGADSTETRLSKKHKELLAHYHQQFEQSCKELKVCVEEARRTRNARGRGSVRTRDLIAKQRRAQIEAFKQEREREQALFDRHRNMSPDPLRSTSSRSTPNQAFAPRFMTPKEYKEHLVKLRRSLVKASAEDLKDLRQRSCSSHASRSPDRSLSPISFPSSAWLSQDSGLNSVLSANRSSAVRSSSATISVANSTPSLPDSTGCFTSNLPPSGAYSTSSVIRSSSLQRVSEQTLPPTDPFHYPGPSFPRKSRPFLASRSSSCGPAVAARHRFVSGLLASTRPHHYQEERVYHTSDTPEAGRPYRQSYAARQLNKQQVSKAQEALRLMEEHSHSIYSHSRAADSRQYRQSYRQQDTSQKYTSPAFRQQQQQQHLQSSVNSTDLDSGLMSLSLHDGMNSNVPPDSTSTPRSQNPFATYAKDGPSASQHPGQDFCDQHSTTLDLLHDLDPSFDPNEFSRGETPSSLQSTDLDSYMDSSTSSISYFTSSRPVSSQDIKARIAGRLKEKHKIRK